MKPGVVPTAPATPPVLVSQGPTAIVFTVPEPADSGGTKVVRYEVEVSQIQAGSSIGTTTLTRGAEVEDMRLFTFNTAAGLVTGFQWQFRAKAHTFTSETFTLVTPWSAPATFYSS